MQPIEKVRGTLQLLHQEGYWGLTHARIWKMMEEFVERQPRIEHYGSTFFTASRVAHVNSAILHMMNLLEHGRDGAHVEYLLNLSELAADEFPYSKKSTILGEVAAQRATLETLRSRSDPFKALRDQAIAHLDRKQLLNPSALRTAFSGAKPTELDGIYHALNEMVNRFEKLANNVYVTWEVDKWNDFEAVGRLLVKAYPTGEVPDGTL